ncbi:MAG: hypothetical protein ACR2MK_11950 [Solirubrobacteraceae bacterium]
MRARALAPAGLAIALSASVAIALSASAAIALSSCSTSTTQPRAGSPPATDRRTATGQRTPEGFIGTMVDGPVLSGSVNLGRELGRIVASGAESLRVAVDWDLAQPYRSFSRVPAGQRSQFQAVGGVPTSFSQLDRVVGLAAQRGLSVLPVVEFAPRWDALHPGDPGSPPRSPAPYAAFLGALARRYGAHGTFWAAHPGLRAVPIEMWQVWNEPNFTSYWSTQPFAASYVRLLAASRAALRSADPGAKLVLAGLPDFSWEYLAEIYRVAGASRTFDIVAVHPYTAQARGVIEILEKVRAVMNRFGDAGKPMLATEISWPSSEGKAPPQFGFQTTEAGQAQRLAQAMPLLARYRSKLGLAGFYWYTWMGDETPRANPYAFDYAGLLKYVYGRIVPKPALGVFKREALAIEGCRSKGSLASSCQS